MKKKIQFVLCFVILFCAIAYPMHYSYYKHKVPPAGWHLWLTCEGRYFIYSDDNQYIMRDYTSRTDGMERQRAINMAWEEFELNCERNYNEEIK